MPTSKSSISAIGVFQCLFGRFLLALPIAVDPPVRARPLEEIHRIGRTHGLSSYDAAYLELAVRHAIPIATLDEELRVAAVSERVTVMSA